MLQISRTHSGLEYSFNFCIKRFLGICTKTELRYERYDLNDTGLRNRLRDMGFVCQVERKP